MKTYNMSDFKIIYAEWQNSGMSIREYCKLNDLKESKFYYWRRKLEYEQETSTGDFLPVNITPSNGKVSISRCGTTRVQQPAMKSSASDEFCCEIVYQNGVKLRVRPDMSFDALKSLLTLF